MLFSLRFKRSLSNVKTVNGGDLSILILSATEHVKWIHYPTTYICLWIWKEILESEC